MLNFGDLVEVVTSKEIIRGIFLPSPDKKVVLIKLGNGYNVGIEKNKIDEIKKIKEVKKNESPISSEINKDKSLPKISLVTTGGTIAARLDYETGAAKWLMDPQQILSLYPEINKIVNIRKVESPFLTSSEDMVFKDWKKLAKIIAQLLNEGDRAVIVTHGTDFLHMTAAALSFMLKNLTKPVILTYSQRSSDRGSSDGLLNLTWSAHLAKSNIAEVMLVGHGDLNDECGLAIRGTKVRKMHTSRRDTFRPINDTPICKVYTDGKIEILSHHKSRSERKVIADTAFEEKIALIKYLPGQDPEILDYFIKKKFKGVVIEVGGLGHVATPASKNDWTKAIKRAIKKGMVVCAAAQTLYGRLDPFVYSNGRILYDIGVIFLEDMLPETAYVKLGWVLGHYNHPEEVKREMLTNYCGELNKRLDHTMFLN